MSEEVDDKLKRLLDAVDVLLLNAADLDECFVDDDNDNDDEDDDYPEDEDGIRWYHDWFELKEARDRFKGNTGVQTQGG